MSKHVTWISHRGVRVAACENTFLAFSEAKKRGFNTFETDLRVSADDHIVFAHDADLTRLAGEAKLIAQLNRSELEKIKLIGGGKLFFFDELVTNFSDEKWLFD